jgi:hypothetical protein
LTDGHQMKVRNPFAFCLVIMSQSRTHHRNIIQGAKYWCPQFFFLLTRKLLKAVRHQLK